MKKLLAGLHNRLHLFVGLILTMAASYFLFELARRAEFSHNPIEWFKADYYEQFIPFFLAGTMGWAGLFALLNHVKTNFYLSLFGFAICEVIILDWTNLQPSYLLSALQMPLFVLSLIALILAYTNVLRRKRLSLLEALFSAIFGAAISIYPMMDTLL